MPLSELLYWEGGIAATYLLAFGALAVGGIDKERLAIARYCLYAVAAIFLGFGMMWGITDATHTSLFRIVVVGIIGAISAIAAVEAGRYVTLFAGPTDDMVRNGPVFDAQLSEVKRVIDFFGSKDESTLREFFDFRNMMDRNIAILNNRILAYRRGEQNKWSYGPFLELPRREMVASAKIAHFEKTESGGVGITHDPNAVYLVVLTMRYQEANGALVQLENSTLVPDTIVSAIKEFSKAINDNVECMIEVLNYFMLKDEGYFIYNMDMSSPKYYGAIQNRYAAQFIPLKPKADAIAAKVKAYLGTK